jgi:hypothetical protein
MPNVTITLDWHGEEALAHVRGEMTPRMEAAADACVRGIQESIATRFPPASAPGEPPHLRTGDLYASIGWFHDFRENTWAVYSDSPYAPFLEYGTAFLAARPFMLPGVTRAMPLMNAALVEG